jgi:selenocysteine lyase/cysteine desulfurase
MIANQRHLFDIPEGVTYFNSAARSPLLRASIAAGEAGITRKAQPWAVDPRTVPDEAETLRRLFAGLIGATADDIAIVSSTSFGAAVAARNLPVGAGQTIVVPEAPFPSHHLVWQDIAADHGARLETIPQPADGDWTAATLERIGADTAVAALPPCRWYDGAIIDAEAVGTRCRETGTAFVLDATQTVGAMPMDVARIQPDFLIASAYKWLLCPYTLGFIYAAPHRQDGRGIEVHQSNHDGEGLAPGARRYDMGEVFNPINLPMAVAALEQLSAWTPAAIGETLRPLTDRIAKAGADRGLIAPPAAGRVGHYIGLQSEAGWPEGMIEALEAESIYLCLRAGALRASPHLFNTADDVDRLFEALDRLL